MDEHLYKGIKNIPGRNRNGAFLAQKTTKQNQMREADSINSVYKFSNQLRRKAELRIKIAIRLFRDSLEDPAKNEAIAVHEIVPQLFQEFFEFFCKSLILYHDPQTTYQKLKDDISHSITKAYQEASKLDNEFGGLKKLGEICTTIDCEFGTRQEYNYTLFPDKVTTDMSWLKNSFLDSKEQKELFDFMLKHEKRLSEKILPT